MPFDRDATLRNAEKMLRQGKLELAIADYRAVIDDQPSDWNTANTLGDLYFRAGQVDKAVAEFGRIADNLASEGFFPKAVALYRKILKIKPDEERAMWHLGGIAARQGLLADARSNYLTLAQRRRGRGDHRGEAEVLVRLGDLDGADLETRVAGARARAELGDAATAVERLKTAAAALQEKGKDADALRLLTEAAQIDPKDADLRRLLVEAYAARGEFDAASQFATSAAELKGIADELLRRGRDDEGINVLRSAADVDPSDVGIRAQLAKLLVARGDIDGARSILTADVAGSDVDLLWTLAEMELRGGRIPQGAAMLEQILAGNRSRRDDIVALGCSLAGSTPDAGLECIDVAVRAAIAADEWEAAAAALNEYVGRVPSHIPALMRLVEVSVDGGLEATMHTAQGQLADAYLAVGAGLEARVIAEDLVAREPWDRAHIERFRCALALLGETDIDGMIADRLSGQSPFTSIDVAGWEAAPETDAAPDMAGVDVTILAESEGADALESEAAKELEFQEVDLSDVLDHLGHDADVSSRGRTAARDAEQKGSPHDSTPETAEEQFKLAGKYVQMGMLAEAMKALEVAARSERHRFRAEGMLAQAYLKMGDKTRAIEWYERAAEAPSPSPAAHHALMYDLAALLEGQGESARALAVWLELQSEAGEYRDVAERLAQLKLQMTR